MEKQSGEYLPNNEIERISDAVETGPDVQKALDKLDNLCEQFEALLDKFGWVDSESKVKMGIAFREALINAVFHGNYGVGKTSDADDIMVLAQVKVRDNPAGIPSTVEVSFSVGRNVVEITIKDHGQGFDLNNVANPLEKQNQLKTSGRGILLMRDAFQVVEYRGAKNNIVHLKNEK